MRRAPSRPSPQTSFELVSVDVPIAEYVCPCWAVLRLQQPSRITPCPRRRRSRGCGPWPLFASSVVMERCYSFSSAWAVRVSPPARGVQPPPSSQQALTPLLQHSARDERARPKIEGVFHAEGLRRLHMTNELGDRRRFSHGDFLLLSFFGSIVIHWVDLLAIGHAFGRGIGLSLGLGFLLLPFPVLGCGLAPELGAGLGFLDQAPEQRGRADQHDDAI